MYLSDRFVFERALGKTVSPDPTKTEQALWHQGQTPHGSQPHGWWLLNFTQGEFLIHPEPPMRRNVGGKRTVIKEREMERGSGFMARTAAPSDLVPMEDDSHDRLMSDRG